METGKIIAKTKLYVKEQLKGAEAGHDWFHIERVYNNAVQIAGNEACDETGKVDFTAVSK